MNINSYIRSGVIEAYVLGVASPDERQELEALLPHHIELQVALSVIEQQFEVFALQQSVPPPTRNRKRYDDFVDRMPVPSKGNGKVPPRGKDTGEDGYIPVEASDTHIRVHKYWRTFVLVLAILFKLLAVAFIIMCVKYFHMRSEVQDMKQKIDQVQSGRR
ncbi:hypothetical protein [Paraflavitalea pollutisoli]|uniref:hypothetical protein n=1 Tax=Paraflavitalea pollutisoli TaxID=3034143 RepID=UPI0023EDC744|nr:hypothetical protein [Paraflavitalea sp. H1-2-19X]